MNKKNYIFVNSERVVTKIYYDDIILITSCKDYCTIITKNKGYMVYFTMNTIIKALPIDMFCRCSRTTIVNVDKIDFIDKSTIHIGNSQPDLSPMYRDELFQKINFISKKTFLES